MNHIISKLSLLALIAISISFFSCRKDAKALKVPPITSDYYIYATLNNEEIIMYQSDEPDIWGGGIYAEYTQFNKENAAYCRLEFHFRVTPNKDNIPEKEGNTYPIGSDPVCDIPPFSRDNVSMIISDMNNQMHYATYDRNTENAGCSVTIDKITEIPNTFPQEFDVEGHFNCNLYDAFTEDCWELTDGHFKVKFVAKT